MSASENTKAATETTQYEVSDKDTIQKYNPQKFTVPVSFIDQGINAGDRQFVNLKDSDSVMYGGPNDGPQRIYDEIPLQTDEPKKVESFRNNMCANKNWDERFKNNMIYNKPDIREGYCSNCEDDKILDIILYTVLAVLLIYVVYKFWYCKKKRSSNPKQKNEEVIEETVEEVETENV